MRSAQRVRGVILLGLACIVVAAGWSVATPSARADTGQRVDLRVLVVGPGGNDPTTQAWTSALTNEGVAYTHVTTSGAPPSENVTFPPLVDPSDSTHGLYNGVILTGSLFDYNWGQLWPLYQYEATFHIRQIDGYSFPESPVGLGPAPASDPSGNISGTTPTLTAAGRVDFPGLKGPVPMDTGTYGYPAAVSGSPLEAGDVVTPLLTDASGNLLMAIDQHPSPDWADYQSGVAELWIGFDYGPSFLQWLILSPGLIDWVTQGAHLGLSRNYFGQDVDDVFLADNSWSSVFHCTPAATDPPDATCPAGVDNNPADPPPDEQMSPADVTHVVEWEKQTGITLELAFNGAGACTTQGELPTAAGCPAGSDPIESSAPDDQGLVGSLLANKASFNWVNHTWSHQFLGCTDFAPMPLDSATPVGSGGALTAGTATYEVTALTAYGESEPSTPITTSVVNGDSVSLQWPDAPNGGGPSLSTLESEFHGGSGFWGYHVYRENPDGTFGLVGTVAEDPSGSTTTYSFTDTGVATGALPQSTTTYPTATNPGILCARQSAWLPASDIESQLSQNVQFAQANGLPNFDPATIVTGEHSGVENPNFAKALADQGVTAFRTDASRQIDPYTVTSGGSTASSAPSYPSNIYYNAANWPDEIDEYNTLYETGAPNSQCVNSSVNTCLNQPATESSILASETTIELRHVLDNDPRVGYAHQMNLIGPATQTVNGVTSDYGYTLLTFLDQVLSEYHSWFTTPLTPVTVSSEAKVLGQQKAWSSALATGSVTATQNADGSITVTNTGGSDVTVPVSAPDGATSGGSPFGTQSGLSDSAWESVAAGGSVTIDTTGDAPAFTSSPTATAQVGTAVDVTVSTSGSPTAALVESGALPSGVTFTDNHDGTATLAGTPAADSHASYPITITATNTPGPAATQLFTLVVDSAPTITSAASDSVARGTAFDFTVTTTGTPVPSLSESGSLPPGTTFTDNGDGTATIAGTTTTAGSFPITVSADNGTAPAATQVLTLGVARSTPTVTWASPASITYGTALSSAQLDATASVNGTFTYTPAAGSTPEGGNQTLSVTFTPADQTDYSSVTTTVPLTVTAAPTAVTWATPGPITYGTLLGSAQLDATAPVAGTFTYDPPAGTELPVGTSQVTATFTPQDAADYQPSSASVQVTVTSPAASLTWATPAAITYGTALSGTQLDAVGSVAGTIVYTPPLGTILHAGTQILSATLTPSDSADYGPVTTTVSLTVNQAPTTVTWATPASIPYGTPLGAKQLDATAGTPGKATKLVGSFTYTPAAGTKLTVGTHTLSVVFTSKDPADYQSSSGSTTVTVTQAVPVITWPKPAAIQYGTPLGSAQLDASTPVAGSFTYTPAAGTLVGVGTGTLAVTFTPSDGADYSPVTATNSLVVKATASTTSLTFTPSVSSAAEASTDFVVTVAPTSGAAVATGTVTVSSVGKALCTATLNASGVGTCTLAAGQLGVGSHKVSAAYAGTSNIKSSKSGTATLVVTS